jgi:SAM-dependent methyltransferase
MNPQDIGKAYDLIVDKWKSPNFDISNGIAQHEKAIAFLQNHRTALDVGCGCSGRIVDLLIKHGFDVEGVDVSKAMIKQARIRHPSVRFHHQDICTWGIPKPYDLISAWDSIWHVPLVRHEHVLKKLFFSLNTGGICIFSAGGVDAPEEKKDSCMGPEVYYSALGISRTWGVISEAGCICRHMEYDQYPELHLFFIVQKA